MGGGQTPRKCGRLKTIGVRLAQRCRRERAWLTLPIYRNGLNFTVGGRPTLARLGTTPLDTTLRTTGQSWRHSLPSLPGQAITTCVFSAERRVACRLTRWSVIVLYTGRQQYRCQCPAYSPRRYSETAVSGCTWVRKTVRMPLVLLWHYSLSASFLHKAKMRLCADTFHGTILQR